MLFATEHPAHYRVMFGPAGASDALPPAACAAGAASFQVLVDAVTAGQRAGVLRAGDTREIALFAWSVVHGLASLIIDGHVGNRDAPVDGNRDGVAPQNHAAAWRALATSTLRLCFEGLRRA